MAPELDPESAEPSVIFYDTSTLPTDAMLEAMRAARLGDDVYGEDPTVNALEALTAEMLGKDASIFMPSGTMANLVAVMAHTRRGEEVVCDAEAHVINYEAGGMALVAGCMPLAITTQRGVLTAPDVEPRLRRLNEHYPRTALILVENTHNRAGGTITVPEIMVGLRDLCDRRGLKLHVDGARIFNAAVALGVSAEKLARCADSVSVCLSKGLSAPVGSMLAGNREFIHEARRIRKSLGGGMRQAGVLAAAGLVALESGLDQLARDNAMARYLASELSTIPTIDVDVRAVETNIVLIGIERSGLSADELVGRLRSKFGIRVSAQRPSSVRFVTHRHIGEKEVGIAVECLLSILGERARHNEESAGSRS
ncbi:MAG: GntG family PLP-dependent aldolase [Acidimicrobiales bacterium]|jgi:threonine aldolase